jgi:hypothetical protein
MIKVPRERQDRQRGVEHAYQDDLRT